MMWKRLKEGLQSRGRYIVAIVALAVAFGLSVQFGDRGVQFDLNETSLSASSASSEGSLSKLKVFNRALLHIKDNYVKPDRIEPGEMLVGALDRVQNLLPPVVIEYEGKENSPTSLTVTVEEETKTFKVKSLASLWQMSFRLKAVFEFIENNIELDEDQKPQDIEYAAINGMLSTLDPHSNLLPPKHFEEMQTQTGGEFGGLGIVISIRDGRLTVISPIDGTPASKQGIQARDRIVRIEDASTINMNLQEAVSMMRGKPGTEVDIWIERKGWSEPKKFTITRDIIKIKSVNSEPLADKVGYIRIKNFQGNTYKDMKTHLKKLKQKMGGMQGLVLDLRDNPGGLLDQAIKVSDLFLKKGTIVSTVGAGEKIQEKKVATKKGTEPDYPMVVLVNAGSASASEIVSGALQNHKRALVLGDTTFGKGTVQVLYEFDDGSALKLTIAEYLTPGGVSIQSRGIVPDLRLIPAHLREKGPVNMFMSDNVMREADLEAHFSNQGAKVAKDKGVAFLRYLKQGPAPNSEEQKEEQQYEDPNEFDRDFPISLGQRLLASFQGDAAGDKMLKKLQPELEKIYSGELEEIQKKLSKFGVDWAAGPTPETPKVSFETSTSIEGDHIKAGGKLEMTATVTNKGEEPLYRLKAITSSANDVLDDRELLFGKVEPGASQSWTVDMEIPKESATRHDLVEFELSDENTTIGGDYSQVVPIQRTDRPSFAFNYAIDDGNGDGTFQVGEKVTFTTHIRNTGSAPSDEVVAYLKNQSDEAVYLEKGRMRLEPIEPGATRQAAFEFRIKEKPTNGAEFIDLRVDVYDATYRGYLQRQVRVPFVAEPGEVSSASGMVEVTKGPAKVFTGADAKSGVVGSLKAGTKAPVTQRQGDWWKVELKERGAWIQGDYVSHDASSSVSAPELSDMRMYAVPDVDVDPSARMTDASEIELKGGITDNTKLKDYYIFVYHREGTSNVKSRKIGYEKVDGASAKVAKTVPLYDGMNRITLVARDEDSMTGQRDIFVYSR